MSYNVLQTRRFSSSHAQRGNADQYEFPRKAWELENTVEGKNTDYYLQKAKNRIEEIGQWGLMPRWEKINRDIISIHN